MTEIEDFRAYDVAERVAAVKAFDIMAVLVRSSADRDALVTTGDREGHRRAWLRGETVVWAHKTATDDAGQVREGYECVWSEWGGCAAWRARGLSALGPWLLFGEGSVSISLALPPSGPSLANATTIRCCSDHEFCPTPWSCQQLLRIDAALDGLVLAALESNGQGDRARRIWELGREQMAGWRDGLSIPCQAG